MPSLDQVRSYRLPHCIAEGARESVSKRTVWTVSKLDPLDVGLRYLICFLVYVPLPLDLGMSQHLWYCVKVDLEEYTRFVFVSLKSSFLST